MFKSDAHYEIYSPWATQINPDPTPQIRADIINIVPMKFLFKYQTMSSSLKSVSPYLSNLLAGKMNMMIQVVKKALARLREYFAVNFFTIGEQKKLPIE